MINLNDFLKAKIGKQIAFIIEGDRPVSGILRGFGTYEIYIENSKRELECFFKHAIIRMKLGKASEFVIVLPPKKKEVD